MGRPRGSRNRPKENGHDAAPAAPGHNSALNDEERRALTLHHKRLYEAADAAVEAAKAERSKVADLAKSELGKGVMKDIKDLVAAGDIKVVRALIERHARLAKWLGHPIAFQGNLFAADLPNDDQWYEDGKIAGMHGETCAPPVTLPASGHQFWIKGWHAGQEIIRSAYGKLKPHDAPVPHQPAETSERPFA